MDSSTATSSDSLSLSLRAWAAEDATAKTLPSLIARVNQHAGGFRTLTESGLEDEIASSSSIAQEGQAEGLEDEEEADEVADADQRKEDLMTAKGEMLGQIRQANNDAMMALDLVSLLLSKDTPRQAEISMSPFLKQHVPLGSLSAEKIQPPVVSDEVKEDRSTISRGWKLGALNSSADMILNSANRLEKEIDQETKYWEQVLAISKKGWSLCRQPREKHTLGVRYGFREAAPDFRDRGLASLRRGEDGGIVLDQGRANATPKSIRVRVQDGQGKISGCSRTPTAFADHTSTENLILEARNTIFEEELMFELNREARVLANQGVRAVGASVAVDLLDRQLLIDLVPLEYEESSESHEAMQDDALSNALALALRILLSHAHRQNLRRRSQIPPPLTERKRGNPPYFLLRPVMTHLLHQSAIRSTESYLDAIKATLKFAGVSAQYTMDVGTSCAILSDSKATKASSVVEQVLQTVIDRLESSVEITLRENSSIEVKVRTQLLPPILGTEYVVSLSKITGAPFSMRFGSEEELKKYIDHLTTLSLVDEIASYSSASTSATDSIEEGGEPSSEAGWARTSQPNELHKAYKKTGKRRLMVVQFSEAHLRLRWGWMSGKTRKGDGSYAWHGKPGIAARKTLAEVAALAGSFEA